jgi:uncharacterized protein YndB with AHSA1/START domain
VADIFHTLPIRASAAAVFEAMTSSAGLAQWWARSATGEPCVGAEYRLDFGPEYQWTARVASCEPGVALEWEMLDVMDDWKGSRVGFVLRRDGERTWLDFHHVGWADSTEHFRISSCCWAAYLRILRRYLEHGETVPYEIRLDV